jgi:hypothetical protein
MPKSVAVKQLLEWLHKPVIGASEDLATLDIWVVGTVENESRNNGELSQTLTTQMQSCQLWALRPSMASLHIKYPVAGR